MKKLAILLYILLATIGVRVLNVARVFAQNTPSQSAAAGISITPPTVEILVAPNKNVIQTFDIKNQGESAQFVASMHLFEPTGTDGLGRIDPRPLDDTALPVVLSLQNADIALDQPFTLKAGESQQLVLRIEAANTDQTEDVYLACVVTSMGTQSDTVRAAAGIASLVLLTVTPDGVIPLDMSIENFTLPFIIDSMSTLKLEPTVKNNSPVMIRPEGTLTIKSARKGTDFTIPLYSNLVLGRTERRIMGSSGGDKPQPQALTWTPGNDSFGPHLIRLTLTTAGGKKIQEVEKTIWIVPFKLILGIVSMLVLTGYVNMISRRKRSIDTSRETI